VPVVGDFRDVYMMDFRKKKTLKILLRDILDMPILRTPLSCFSDANLNHLRGAALRVY
jgi:hypothetical protein